MGYITTYSGESFNPLAPDMDKIKIEDIAHSLSLMCRGNGHLSHFFSVAQHCINCAKEAEARGLAKRVQLACLLHDASESYLSDITRPVKRHLPVYIEIEENMQNAVYRKFLGSVLSEEECSQVRQIDDDMLVNEFAVLLKHRLVDRVAELKSKPFFDIAAFADVKMEFTCIFDRLSSRSDNARHDEIGG